MNWRKRRRQVLLFLGAILVPALVLAGLAVKVFRQERTLATVKASEERRNAILQLRRELTGRLETIKLEEINRLIRSPGASTGKREGNSPIVFVTTFEGQHMVLPWEHQAQAKPSDAATPFSTALTEGESSEFASKDFNAAAGSYRRAIAAASGLTEKCEAELSLGRLFIKANRMEAAKAPLVRVVHECDAEADDEGIEFRLYAAGRLLQAGLDPALGRQTLASMASDDLWRPPLQLYFMRTLLAETAPANLAARIKEAKRLSAISQDFPRILVRAEPPDASPEGPPHDSLWLAYGDEPLLLKVIPATPPLPALVFAISSTKVVPPEARFLTAVSTDSEAVGDEFPGLRVEWPEGTGSTSVGPPASLYAAGLVLMLGITLLGGYLLLRDVDRDVAASVLRSHFVASVSHELKTPLTAIRIYAEMLVRGQTGDARTTSEYHQTILHESERLTQLVDNVLDFSRIEQHNKVYVLRPTSLPHVVHAAARAVRYPLEQEGFTLAVSVDEHLPEVSADDAALERAVVNLLTNAMKYSGASRRIELALKRDNNEAAIEVTDWGFGIAPQHQERIFEEFYRVRSADTDSIGGTGLGLTLATHIARAHGGRVSVSSEPGHGSVFAIRIPLDSPGAPA